MLADPQSITINAVALSFAAVSREKNSSTYANVDASDVERELKISHSESASRRRHLYRLDTSKIATDPFTSNNVEAGMSVYLVIDKPKSGFTDAEVFDEVEGMVAEIDETLVNSLLLGES
jgi:hypothetical protein